MANVLKREQNEIGPAWWKIPFHSTYEIWEIQTGNFGRMERAQGLSSLAPMGGKMRDPGMSGKMRDPGNEVGLLQVRRCFHSSLMCSLLGLLS